MKNIFETVKNNQLFKDISPDDFAVMLNCLSAREAVYKKDEVILLEGSGVSHVGIVLSGGVRIIKEDADGRCMILSEIGAPEMFGEVFACAGIESSPVTVLASAESRILFIDYKRIVSSCTSACPFHMKLIENMLSLVAMKNLMLNRKIEILSKRTTRAKILAFFDQHRGGAGSFTIPYNRGELADYLCVDRSAMTIELGKMRGEGLIKYNKNSFEIL